MLWLKKTRVERALFKLLPASIQGIQDLIQGIRPFKVFDSSIQGNAPFKLYKGFIELYKTYPSYPPSPYLE